MTAPSPASNAPTRVGNMAGPMRCRSPSRYCCASRMKAAADRDEDQPRPEVLRRPDAHQVSVTPGVDPPRSWSGRASVHPADAGGLVARDASVRDAPRHEDDRRCLTALRSESIRPDVRLLDDDLKRSNSCVTRASRSAALDGMVSTPPAAKRSLTSGRARIFTTSALSLSMMRLGRALRCEQRRPVGRIHLLHARLLQGRPVRTELRPLRHSHRQRADAAGLDVRGQRTSLPARQTGCRLRRARRQPARRPCRGCAGTWCRC